MKEIMLQPIGEVISAVEEIDDMIPGGTAARIEILPACRPGLYRIEENSHLWILCWFHRAPRDRLRASPHRMDPSLGEFGVFALRGFARPNPIALSLVTLEGVEENILYVRGLDAISGTPVLDIKPYFENDSIFSPRTPYIRYKSRDKWQNRLQRMALAHHREECHDLHLAVRMALLAEEQLGQLNRDEVKLAVKGSPCLADCLQGLTRARLANPPRFSYMLEEAVRESHWQKGDSMLSISLQAGFDPARYREIPDTELFLIRERKT